MRYLISILFAITTCCSAQQSDLQVLASAGDNATGTFGSLSWTIGEPMVETFTAGNTMLTQGFQQPAFVITNVNEQTNKSPVVALYPNPATERFSVQINSPEQQEWIAELYDFSGQLIKREQLTATIGSIQTFNISMLGIATGKYLFRLTSTNGDFHQLNLVEKVQ